MSTPIPLITGEDGAILVNKLRSNSEFVRVGLYNTARYLPLLTFGPKVWMDPCVDGMDNMATREESSWFDFIKEFSNYELVGSPEYHLSPKRPEVAEFVKQIMDKCAEHQPAWITVPQLPAVDSTGRNKINRALAEATGHWKAASGFEGNLILPLILTSQGQSINKTARNPKVATASKCYEESGSTGLWVVDKSLQDDTVSHNKSGKRFAGIVELHDELNRQIDAGVRIAGPYWSLNLVLWAKGLVDYPLIGIGSSYQFFMSGGHTSTPSTRVALPSLRRRVRVNSQLPSWLDTAILTIDPSDPAHAELCSIRDRFNAFNEPSQAREQVAGFYKNWCDETAAKPTSMRSHSLYDNFSKACMLGSKMPDLDWERNAKRPEFVAKAMLFTCL